MDEPGDDDAMASTGEVAAGPAGPDGAWVERVRMTYDDVRGPLFRALLASTASTEVADDALAEGFTQLLRRGDEVRDPAAWVWRASFRIAAGELQRRSLAAAQRAGGDRGSGDGDPVAVLAGRVDRLPDDAIDLVRALAQLSDQQRRCVALVDVAGHTAPSAAAVLGTSAATVRVQLMRARRHLRTLLADHERAPRSLDGRGQGARGSATAAAPTGSAVSSGTAGALRTAGTASTAGAAGAASSAGTAQASRTASSSGTARTADAAVGDEQEDGR